MIGIARGKAENEIVGNDQEGEHDQREHIGVPIEPIEKSAQKIARRRECAIEMDVQPGKHISDVSHLFTRIGLKHAVDGTCQQIDHNTQHGNNRQHLDRRETHLPLTVDIVTDEISWTQEELQQCVRQRTGMHAPHLSNTVPHTVPCDRAKT